MGGGTARRSCARAFRTVFLFDDSLDTPFDGQHLGRFFRMPRFQQATTVDNYGHEPAGGEAHRSRGRMVGGVVRRLHRGHGTRAGGRLPGRPVRVGGRDTGRRHRNRPGGGARRGVRTPTGVRPGAGPGARNRVGTPAGGGAGDRTRGGARAGTGARPGMDPGPGITRRAGARVRGRARTGVRMGTRAGPRQRDHTALRLLRRRGSGAVSRSAHVRCAGRAAAGDRGGVSGRPRAGPLRLGPPVSFPGVLGFPYFFLGFRRSGRAGCAVSRSTGARRTGCAAPRGGGAASRRARPGPRRLGPAVRLLDGVGRHPGARCLDRRHPAR